MQRAFLKWAFFAILLSGCRTSSHKPDSETKDIKVDLSDRASLVQSGKVFQGIEAPESKTELEIKNGPFPEGATPGKDYFTWGTELTCKFSEENFDNPPGGLSPKFICDILGPDGEVVSKKVKIKYDAANPELYNEAAGSRLFWLLGYPADYYYHVKIECLGCPPDGDLWAYVKKYRDANDSEKTKMRAAAQAWKQSPKARVIDPAVIEKKFAEPVVLKENEDSGWSFFDDLAPQNAAIKVPGADPAAELAKRHALVIIAGMISHVDNQPGNQRIYCKGAAKGAESCAPDKSWLIIHDLGATMGGFRLSWDVRTGVSDKAQLSLAMNFWESSKSTAVFTSSSSCEVSVGSLSNNQTLGPLKKVKVSEAGRQFLLSRFVALGGGTGTTFTPEVNKTIRTQLEKVFIAGRNGELYKDTKWWVDTLMSKLEIVKNYEGCK